MILRKLLNIHFNPHYYLIDIDFAGFPTRILIKLNICIVGENNIGAPKMRNIFGTLSSCPFDRNYGHFCCSLRSYHS